MKSQKEEIMSFIPLREGSKRIPNKNARFFLGKSLLAYTIKLSKKSPLITRTIVCTESPKIAKMAKKYGAEVPFLRPKKYASDRSDVVNSLLYTLKRLRKGQNYEPAKVIILQATSPLREEKDITDCYRMMRSTNATTVLTVTRSHPKFYHLSRSNKLILDNGSEEKTSITQKWVPGYILNGCTVYIVDTKALYREKRIITKNTKAVVMPKWRSIDLDEIEDWVMAEILFKNKELVNSRIREIENEKN